MDRVILIILSCSVFTVTGHAEIWTLKIDSFVTNYNVEKINQVRVSTICKKSKCEALRVLKKKHFMAPMGSSSTETMIPGSGATCQYLGGHIFILTNEKNIQEQFCKFDDNSILSITDYYRL